MTTSAREIRYYGIARRPDDRIGQVLVVRRNGRQVSQEWTGVVYATEEQADADLKRLNGCR